MTKEYQTAKIVIKPGIGEYTEKKSRFIAEVRNVETEEEAAAFVNEIKKKYWDARHNCMAFVLGESRDTMRFSDDGEPSGTAGKPILDVILGNQIINAAIVVTRYFGGILLGTGGLVRAYQKAAQEALENSVIAEKSSGIQCQITTDYNGLGKIQYLSGQEGIKLLDIRYSDMVEIDMVCEVSQFAAFKKRVTDITAAKACFEKEEPVSFYRSQNEIIII